MDVDAPALWSRLPLEIEERVLSLLPVPDLCRCRSVQEMEGPDLQPCILCLPSSQCKVPRGILPRDAPTREQI